MADPVAATVAGGGGGAGAGPWGIVGGAAVGLLGSVIGGSMGADAANKSSQAQERMAQDWIINQRSIAEQALKTYNQYVPAMQAGFDKAYAAQTQHYNRMQDLVNQINPALLDAGKQMKDLLDGKAAPILKNLQDQRNLQRTDMMNTLRQQLGPGAETSSVGQQAMQKFDAQTADMMSGAQQQYLSQVGNLALHGGDSLNAGIDQAIGGLSQIASQYGQIGRDKANILGNQAAGEGQAYGGALRAAGNSYAGQAILGETVAGIGKAVGQGISAYAAMPGGSSPGGGTLGSDTMRDTGGMPSGGLQMPELGSTYGQSSQTYGLGSLGGAPQVASYRPAPAAGAPFVPSTALGFSSNYGGGGNDAYNLNPQTMKLGGSDFNFDQRQPFLRDSVNRQTVGQ